VHAVPVLNDAARALLESPTLAQLTTLDPDGAPQVSAVWVGLDGDDIVSGHMRRTKKVRNVAADGRVALALQTDVVNSYGLQEYMVVRGRARVEEGGAAALLQRLAHVYLGPDVVFPPPGVEGPGYVIRTTPAKVTGVGPWVP
jgi:PPOX class probable F420-dependent enzyme